ncbi:DUF2905 domain-containing protein [Paraburkholderia sp.]|uniref:DUF2905 domain-containing protein n=1 Tax=Paraburkholderia sp. TaxID=1926495 RepID=UPI00239144CF|nr:DUF2905 domain-containing protein [Paraburkholderia sp.]MDE1181176.1 DUF2905 domain-containing protein [Paraburkholderia sp.]
MIRWLITTFVATMILSACWPWLRKIGVGRMPGDVSFTLFGRTYYFPFMSSIILTFVFFALARAL